MPVNDGTIHIGLSDAVYAECYYAGDPEGVAFDPPNQAIIDRNGVAFRVVNNSGADVILHVEGPTGKLLGPDGTEDVRVTSAGFTATAQQLRVKAGIRTRADFLNFSLSMT